MKYIVKKDKNDPYKCTEPCPFLNKDISEWRKEHLGVKIGSGFCQGCEHHKNNNMIEKYGKDYDVSKGNIMWIECDKLTGQDKLSTAEKIILALDNFGRKINPVEYGLPIDPDTKDFNTSSSKEMLKIVNNILNDLSE